MLYQRRGGLTQITMFWALPGSSRPLPGGCGWSWVASAASYSGPAVPVVIVGAYAEDFRQRPQRREHQVLHPCGRRGDPAFVAEVPEGGAELERVLRCAGRRGLAVGGQAGEGLVELLGLQCRAVLDDPVDLGRSGFSTECGTPAGMTTVSPALATCSWPLRVKRTSPATMVNCSCWPGWMCSGITPPGALRQLKRTSCPSLSSAVAVYWIHSPVAGLRMGRKPVAGPSASGMIIGPSRGTRLSRAGGSKACEIAQAGGGGAQEQDAGRDAGGHGERRARHRGDQDDRSGDHRPADRAVAGDFDQVVEPEQQRPDCDHDGRQHPAGVADRGDDDGQDEGCGQLDDGGGGHGPPDPPGLGAGWPRSGAVRGLYGVGEHADHGDGRRRDQRVSCVATDGPAGPRQPEGGEGGLDEPADAAHPPRPCHGRGSSAAFTAVGSAVRGPAGLSWCYLLRFGCHGVLVRVRHQATVVPMASASGVPAAPKTDWYLLVSRRNGSSNW